jgi:hypothetical protein
MSTAWDNQRTKPINVYGPPRTENLVKAAVQYFSISAEIRIADGGRTIPIGQLFFGHDVAVLTGTQTGRTFRGLVRHANTLDVQEMRLLPIDPRQVVIRSRAVAPCYTIVRGALEDELLAHMLKVRMAEMAARLERYQHRAEKRRQLVRDVMLEADIKKLQMPDFTASLRNAPPHVVVTDEKLIPQSFWEMRPHLRKADLLAVLKDGVEVEGAALSNAGMSLSVRTR